MGVSVGVSECVGWVGCMGDGEGECEGEVWDGVRMRVSVGVSECVG